MKLIRGISGIRGIVNQTLTDSVLTSHALAFSKLQIEGSILLARDSRSHGEKFINTTAEALKYCGREVLNYGIIPTPTAQFLVEKNGMAGGIVITASHNPAKWNGLKFIDSNGCFLDGTKNKHLFEIADADVHLPAKSGSITTIVDGCTPHIKHTLKLSVIDTQSIADRNFTIVVDTVNGAAFSALPSMVEALGCQVHQLHCKPNGKFPRGPEPLSHNLKQLGEAVISHKADAGFATDPDGDRLAVVDEKGRPLSEEYTLTICADGFFNSTGSTKPLVTNLSSTMALDRVAEKHGSSVIRSAVGEINVVNTMKETGALLGGEGNGGVILTESHYGRDSLVGATLFLNRMTQGSQTTSEIFHSMPQFIMIKDKIELGTIDPQTALDKIEAEFTDAKTDKTDGLKLSWDNYWVHIRKSNTEPIIRIYAEGKTEKITTELVEGVKQLV